MIIAIVSLGKFFSVLGYLLLIALITAVILVIAGVVLAILLLVRIYFKHLDSDNDRDIKVEDLPPEDKDRPRLPTVEEINGP